MDMRVKVETMTKRFRLVEGETSHDTIIAAKEILSGAESGEVIGAAFVIMYKGRDYVVEVTGEAYNSPTFTRGMVRALDDKLQKMVHGIA